MTYNQERILKFLKACYWNFGIYILLFMIDTISTRLGVFNLDPFIVGLIAILAARLTKVLNSEITARKEIKALE